VTAASVAQVSACHRILQNKPTQNIKALLNKMSNSLSKKRKQDNNYDHQNKEKLVSCF
jgi:hypothetical protein